MKTTALMVALALAAALAWAGSGAYNFGADDPHWDVTERAIEWLRERSVERRAARLDAPADLYDPERIRRGAGNYDAMCVGCHLRPGLSDTELRRGLYPAPPDLVAEGRAHPPTEQFWVIKHGIKASGMPAWSRGGVDDATIWDLVALILALPELDAAEYRALVTASDGHSHGGADDHAGGHGHGEGNGNGHPHPPAPEAEPAPHDHSTHTH